MTMTPAGDRRVTIACQGGGSHTAFTAGVLARLFEDGLAGHEVVGLSGTSGGAICALLAWTALCSGDPAGAGPLLEQFWADNSATTLQEQWVNSAVALAGELQRFIAMPEVSPYDNPFAETGAREFQRLLERRVDFDSIAPDPSRPALLIGAVDVLSGAFRAFDSRRDRITANTILASAAIPTLFESVHIDDGVYWDGLFSQNPPIRELAALAPDEIWVIQINPSRRDTVPRTMLEIADRRNELAGNLSLYQELRFIEQIDQMLEAGQLVQDGSYRRIVVRIIELSPARVSRPLSARSKVDRDPGLINELIAHGRQQADEFLLALGLEQAWRARDAEAVLEWFDDSAELVATAPFAAAGPIRGREHLSAFLAEHLGTLQLDLTRKQVARDHVTWSVKTPAGVGASARIAVRDGRVTSLTLGPATADG
jgi:NTE family protein